MENYLKHKMQMEKDDLKDCSMLMDYAEEAKAHGDTECATFFFSRAKKRWEDYRISSDEVSKEIEKMKGSAKDVPDSIQGMLYNMLIEEQKERVLATRHRIENFSM